MHTAPAWVRILAAATVAAAAVGLQDDPAAAAPVYPAPDSDGFYAAPSDIAGYEPGDVIRSRRVQSAIFPAVTIWQLLYRSTNSAGVPIAAVTTVLVPPGGPDRPLVSYQPFVNSLGLHCAPSHALFDGSLREAPALNLLLARGWAVAIPDHLGPTSAYGAAQLGGRLTLDGIRAARRFGAAGLSNSPVGMLGYSGGGMATGFAAALAPRYAPELPLVGSAQGGVPVDLGKLALDVGRSPNPLFGLGFAAAVGLEREYPDQVRLDRLLNPAGIALRARLADACTNEIIDAGADHRFDDFFDGPLEADAPTVEVLRANSLSAYPGVPRVPIYEWHGATDVVSPQSVREMTARYCASGAVVDLDLIPGADHGGAMLPGAVRAIEYLGDRFAGESAPSTC